MRRWPSIALVVLMIAGLVVADWRSSRESDAAEPVALDSVVAGATTGSTWYCPAGFVTPDAMNDHVLIITNRSERQANGSLTLYPSLLNTVGEPVLFERAAQRISIEPLSQQQVSLAPLVILLDERLAGNTGAFVGSLVEFDLAGVTVEHSIVSPTGRDAGPCSDRASDSWWFASGTTTADVRYLLYLLNPFRDDAVVDVRFVRDDGVRTPVKFDGRLVPGQSLIVLPVEDEVSVWPQVTAEVTTRTGRVIVERLQVFSNPEGPSGLSVSLGAETLSEQWYFPAGRAVPEGGESYVIYNPGDEVAEVEFEVKPDAVDSAGDLAPTAINIGSGERWVVTVDEHATHPDDTLATLFVDAGLDPTDRYFVTVRSFNGVPVVVERVVTLPGSQGSGVAATLGLTVTSTDQTMSIPPGERDDAVLAILNPAADTIARVQVIAGNASGEQRWAELELGPRRRGVFRGEAIGLADAEWLRVVSTTGTISELVLQSADGLQYIPGQPVEGTEGEPDLLAFD